MFDFDDESLGWHACASVMVDATLDPMASTPTASAGSSTWEKQLTECLALWTFQVPIGPLAPQTLLWLHGTSQHFGDLSCLRQWDIGGFWGLNLGPPAPKAEIIPLDEIPYQYLDLSSLQRNFATLKLLQQVSKVGKDPPQVPLGKQAWCNWAYLKPFSYTTQQQDSKILCNCSMQARAWMEDAYLKLLLTWRLQNPGAVAATEDIQLSPAVHEHSRTRTCNLSIRSRTRWLMFKRTNGKGINSMKVQQNQDPANQTGLDQKTLPNAIAKGRIMVSWNWQAKYPTPATQVIALQVCTFFLYEEKLFSINVAKVAHAAQRNFAWGKVPVLVRLPQSNPPHHAGFAT
ncbi:hypothetical protein DFJ73DRAFT_909121 [Zopfochytrium polystomum]|nr:hypothetical protein DFJ73DRAFT_909121 [Zopfochytrium polystomum]